MWDFSFTGWQGAIKEFFASLVKNVLVAAAAFVALRLADIQIDPTATNADLFAGLIVVGRALVSAFLKWVNTTPMLSGPADEVVTTA